MNLGIITFHRALNYGAVLQAYALQHFLTEIDIDSKIIDYRCEEIEYFYKPIKANPIKNIKKFLKECCFYTCNKNKRKKFMNFLNKNLLLTKKIDTEESLLNLNALFDCFITGSDQVWNNRWTGLDGAFFLNFAESKKKNSYAASFGFSSVPQECEKKYREYLSDFNFLSVRELDGVGIVENLTGKSAVVSIDPTCLISREEWISVAKLPKEKDYVLLYLLEQSSYLEGIAKELAARKGIKVITIADGFKRKRDIKKYGFLGPDEFLGLFHNARYIVTNSFHGLMFSVIFRKEFYISYQQYSGAPNSRLRNFIVNYHLEGRVLSENQPLFEAKIDYDEIESMIKSSKEYSKKYFYTLREYYEKVN